MKDEDKTKEKLLKAVRERKYTREMLQKAYYELEKIRVEERTAELKKANKKLKLEIAERKRVEKELQESEQRLKTILETLQIGIIIIDAKTHEIIDINPKALEMMGASKEQIVGCVCHKHICPTEEGKCPITDLGQILDKTERTLLKINGEKITILKSVISVNLGGRQCLLESFMDITECN